VPIHQTDERLLKKAGEPHCGISLHFMYYNFVRIHQTLRITPAMAAGVTDHVWEVSDIVKLLEDKPEKPNYQDEAHYGPALGSDPQRTRRQGQVCLSG
jgi:hypothetical protein